MQRLRGTAVLSLLALTLLGIQSCSSARLNGTKVFCGSISQNLARHTARASGGRAPASLGAEMRPEWAVSRLNETQRWMDQLEGARDASRVRAVLSDVAIQWVSLFAHLQNGRQEEGRETLRRIVKIHDDGREILCQP